MSLVKLLKQVSLLYCAFVLPAVAVQWRAEETIFSWGTSTMPEWPPGLVATAETSGTSLGVLADGRVMGWGQNPGGLLDIPADLTNAVDVIAGPSFGAALTREGTVRTWGTMGSVGLPSVPQPEDLHDVRAMAVGWGHLVTLLGDGTVRAWGDNGLNQCDVPAGLSNVIAVRAGHFLSLALQADGTAVAWGRDEVGLPIAMRELADVAIAGDCVLLVRRGGTVESFGSNGAGLRNVPPELTNAVAVVAGDARAMALTSEGRLVMWPGDEQPPAGLSGVTTIYAAGQHCLASTPLACVLVAPQSQAVEPGADVSFSVVATNRFPLAYQWQFNGTDLPDETNASLHLRAVRPDQAGYYRVVLLSGQARTVAGAGLAVGRPLILRQPADITCDERSNPTLSVTVLSGTPVEFQWRVGDAPIPGATAAALTLTNVQVSAAGVYSVVVSNRFGAVVSADAVLRVGRASLEDQVQRSLAGYVALRWNSSLKGVLAQTITPAVSGRLEAIDLGFVAGDDHPTDPVLVEVVSTTNSVPAGPVLGYSVLPADAGSTVRFTGPEIYLTAGQPYAIVLSTRAPSPPVSGYFFGVAGIDAYPRGGLWLRTAGAWEPLANNDLLFVTHMDPNVPEIRLDTPRNGARLREGEPLRLRALWGAGGPPPVRVDFLANARPLGSVAQEPYELIWNDPPAGLQNLVAIAVTATGSSTGRVVAVSVLPPGPANDDFAHRNRLDGAWVRAAFGNAGATREPGEHLPLATTGQTLWWSWTANSLATTTVAVGGPASTNAVIGVYRGAVAEALVQVAQGIGACSFLGESGSEYQIQVDSMDAVLAGATLEVATPDLELTGPVPGTGYRAPAIFELSARATGSGRPLIQVEFRAGELILGATEVEPFTVQARLDRPGHYQLQAVGFDDWGVGVASPTVPIVVHPENDRFEDAIPLPGAWYDIHTSNAGGTLEGAYEWGPGIPPAWIGEPRWADNLGGHSLWYSWTAPEDGTCRITGQGHGFGLLLAAYTGTAVDALGAVAANPYAPAGTPIEWPAVAGTTYRICVDGLVGEEGELDWSLRFRPKNDTFADRTRLRGSQLAIIASVLGAGLEAGEAALVGTNHAGSTWWSWTAPVSARVTISTVAEAEDSRVMAFVGNALDQLALVAASPATWTRVAQAQFDALAGVEYQIVILAQGDPPARFRFTIAMDLPQLASPLAGSIHAAPADLDLSLLLSAGPPAPRAVRFYANNVLIATVANPPFTFHWEDVSPGTYSLQVRVAGSDGRVSTSEPISILVYADETIPKPQIFAPVGGSSSYVVNAIGELQSFGAVGPLFGQPQAVRVWPTLSQWPEQTGRWQQVYETDTGWAIAADGALWRNASHRIPLPAGVSRWLAITFGWQGFLLALGDDGRVYAEDGTLQQLGPPEVLWTDLVTKPQGVWSATLARDGRAFLHAWDWSWKSVDVEIRWPAGVSRWRRISMMNSRCLLWSEDGRLYEATEFATQVPQLIPEPVGVVSWLDFAAGDYHVLAIGSDGQLYAWGQNSEGQLGLGGAGAAKALPTLVPLPPGVTAWSAVAAGARHSLAIGNDCQLYAWGSNNAGQLGVGSLFNEVAPTLVPSIGNLCGIPIIYTNGETASLPDGAFRLRFRSDLNRHYLIQYSANAVDWKNATPPLIGTGEVTEWIDDGPPKTETHPAATPRRYYRVTFAP